MDHVSVFSNFKYFKEENISQNILMQNPLDFPESEESIFSSF